MSNAVEEKDTGMYLVQLPIPFFLYVLNKCVFFLVKASLLKEQNGNKNEINLIIYATYLSQELQ